MLFHQDNYVVLLGCNIGPYVISKRAYPVKTNSSRVSAEHCIKLASGIRKVAECRRPIGCKQVNVAMATSRVHLSFIYMILFFLTVVIIIDQTGERECV